MTGVVDRPRTCRALFIQSDDVHFFLENFTTNVTPQRASSRIVMSYAHIYIPYIYGRDIFVLARFAGPVIMNYFHLLGGSALTDARPLHGS